MESILTALSHPAALIVFLIGSGGLTTLITAWIGWRQKHDDRQPTPAVVLADRQAFDRLGAQVERLADLIEKALERYELIKMIESMRSK